MQRLHGELLRHKRNSTIDSKQVSKTMDTGNITLYFLSFLWYDLISFRVCFDERLNPSKKLRSIIKK